MPKTPNTMKPSNILLSQLSELTVEGIEVVQPFEVLMGLNESDLTDTGDFYLVDDLDYMINGKYHRLSLTKKPDGTYKGTLKC